LGAWVLIVPAMRELLIGLLLRYDTPIAAVASFTKIVTYIILTVSFGIGLGKYARAFTGSPQ
jgi:hypothetical protein